MSERVVNLKDPYRYVVDNVTYGVYDTNGNLICKVKNKRDAEGTVAEFRKIDKDLYGKKRHYLIRKLC